MNNLCHTGLHRNFIITLLTAFVSASLLDVNGAEASDLTFDTSGATAIVMLCDNTASGALEIPTIHEGKAVTAIGAQAFNSCVNLTGVSLPASVSTIGDNAFYNCTSLANVRFGENLTSIGVGSFEGCSQLKVLHFEGNAPVLTVVGFTGVSAEAKVYVTASATGFGTTFGGLPVLQTSALDTTAPVISLIGDALITIQVGSTYTDQDATVTDDVDATRTVQTDDAVDSNTVGNYTLRYHAMDAAGNA
ncbi:leucine-rich repeat protein, partial [bacterium]|nr:leucine-rich repeat protein [bacterium]